MRVILQRVRYASVTVNSETIGAIGSGLMLLVGIGADDTEQNLTLMSQKVVHLRVFPDDSGRFDRSLLDIEGEILLIPQFTLYGDTKKGRRPEFFGAMEPEKATKMFDTFTAMIQKAGVHKVQTGQFGAHMLVASENDGPVTLILEY